MGPNVVHFKFTMLQSKKGTLLLNIHQLNVIHQPNVWSTNDFVSTDNQGSLN